MLTDGIQLLGTTTADNFAIISGATLPSGAQTTGELYYKTGVGLHVYDGSAWVAVGTSSAGTVTAVSVTTANGVSGAVSNATTTPAITLTLGNITPTSVTTTSASVIGAMSSGTASTGRPILTAVGSDTSQLRLETASDGIYYDLGRGTSGLMVLKGSQGGYVGFDFQNESSATMFKIQADGNVVPGTNNTKTLGTSSLKWSNVFATTFTGALSGNATTATSATTSTNVAGGAVGSLVIQTGAGATGFVAAGTSGYVLTSTGTSTAPTWQAAAGGGSTAAGTLTGTTLASNVVNASISALTANSVTVGSQTGAVTTPSSIVIDQSYASTATPSNKQSKLYLFNGATDTYSFGISNDAGLWYHAGDTSTAAGTVGYHQWASQNNKRMRLTPVGNLYIGNGTASNGGTQPLQIERNQAGIVRSIILNSDVGSTTQIDMGVQGASGSFFTGMMAATTAADATVVSTSLTTNDIYAFGVGSTQRYSIFTNQLRRFTITAAGDIVIGTGALATTATTGFLNIPACAGLPTGVPTTFTGRAPLVVDSTNNALYFYSNSAWRVAGGTPSTTIPVGGKSADYTLVLADAGSAILHNSADTTARTFTIPANASVAFPIGTTVTFVNQNNAGGISIAITTDTMRLAGAGTSGTRTLAANGIATAFKITSTEWIISGTGLS